jgi:hypothetical protein
MSEKSSVFKFNGKRQCMGCAFDNSKFLCKQEEKLTNSVLAHLCRGGFEQLTFFSSMALPKKPVPCPLLNVIIQTLHRTVSFHEAREYHEF